MRQICESGIFPHKSGVSRIPRTVERFCVREPKPMLYSRASQLKPTNAVPRGLFLGFKLHTRSDMMRAKEQKQQIWRSFFGTHLNRSITTNTVSRTNVAINIRAQFGALTRVQWYVHN